MDINIPYTSLRQYTYCNDHLINGTISGVAVEFCGLNNTKMQSEDMERGILYAQHGILYLYPYIIRGHG